jgi:histidinol-phosphate aminotransferase
VLHTFSKIYGLAGLRIGYGLTSSEIADVLGRLRKPFNVNQPAICAAIAALDDHAFLEKSRQANSTEQTRLLHALASFGLDCIAQSGNFLTTQVGPQAISLCEKLLQRGVIIRDLAPYKMPEYLRISVGLPEENSHFLSELKSLLR